MKTAAEIVIVALGIFAAQVSFENGYYWISLLAAAYIVIWALERRKEM